MNKRKSWSQFDLAQPIHEYVTKRLDLNAGRMRGLFWMSFTAALFVSGILIIANYGAVKPLEIELKYRYQIWANLSLDPLIIRDFGGDIYVYNVWDRYSSDAYSRRLNYGCKTMVRVLVAGISASFLTYKILFWVPGVYSIVSISINWIDGLSKALLKPLDDSVFDMPELQVPSMAMFAFHNVNYEDGWKYKMTPQSSTCNERPGDGEKDCDDDLDVIVLEPLEPEALLQKYLSKVFPK